MSIRSAGMGIPRAALRCDVVIVEDFSLCLLYGSGFTSPLYDPASGATVILNRIWYGIRTVPASGNGVTNFLACAMIFLLL